MIASNRYNNAGHGSTTAALSSGGGGDPAPATEIWNAGPTTVSFGDA
jgi:hypothetical protein